MSLWVLALGVGLILFDCQNVLSHSKRRVLGAAEAGCEDFTIVIPVYGSPRYFDESQQRALTRLKPHILIALETTPLEMKVFAKELQANGWRVACVQVDPYGRPRFPTPALLTDLVLSRVSTTFVMRMDADTEPLDDVSRYVESMRKDGADLCSCKVIVRNPKTSCESFQALEYRMAMLSRHYRPWLTSGACHIARTSALRAILSKHNKAMVSEDIEMGRIALALQMRIRHLDLRVQTDAPNTWRSLFKQRMLWWGGMFSFTVVNFDKNIFHLPILSFYYVVLFWFGMVVKLDGFAAYSNWVVALQGLALVWILYAGLTLLCNWQVRSWRMAIYPVYSLGQALILPIPGIYMYARLAFKQGVAGRYRFGYRKRDSRLLGRHLEALEKFRAEEARARKLMNLPAPRTARPKVGTRQRRAVLAELREQQEAEQQRASRLLAGRRVPARAMSAQG